MAQWEGVLVHTTCQPRTTQALGNPFIPYESVTAGSDVLNRANNAQLGPLSVIGRRKQP